MPTSRMGNGWIGKSLLSLIAFTVLLVLLLPGCNGGGGNPASPTTEGDGPPAESLGLTAEVDYPGAIPGQTGGKAVWGYWDVTYDGVSDFEVVPLRGVEYKLNVNTFLQPPAGSIANISVNVVNMEKLLIAGDVTVDVTLTHPFPALTVFTGFDVLGVFISTGTYVANSDAGIMYSMPRKDAILKNADGYTRWMNPMEFVSGGIVGYTEGALGNKHQFWNSTLNPYKYFADDLYVTEEIVHHFGSAIAVNQRGLFSTTASNTRRYDINFPMVEGKPIVKFQYGILASWVEPNHTPPTSIPGDFPAEANMQEAFHCAISTAGSSLYWNSMYDHGGSLFLTLQVLDWQGLGNPSGVTGEIKEIILDSPDEFINGGNKMVFGPGSWTELPGDCSNSIKLALDVGVAEPMGPCPYDNDVLITIVTAEQGNYDNGLGAAYPNQAILSGYARLFYDLGNICNDPPILWFENCPTKPLGAANKTFRWDAEDDVTPNGQLEFRHKMDADAWSGWETDQKAGYYENMAESDHTLWVECRDLDGQVSQIECNFTITLPPVPQPPEVEFANCWPYVRNPTKVFNLDIQDDFTPLSHIKVRYQYDGGPWVNLPDGSTSITISGLTSGGPHQLIVEIEDLDEMTDQAICDFDVNFKPDVTIDNCPAQDLNSSTYNFTWTGTDAELDALEYQTQLDLGGWSGWGAATARFLNALSSGNHVFYVRVRDATGGTDQTQCNFSVNFGPTISIDNPPSLDVNTTSYTFNFTSTDDLDSPLTLDYNVELDGIWQGWQTGILSYNWAPLVSGPHTFRVRVRDSGNPGLWAEDVCNFMVNFKPSVTIDNCPVGVWPSSDYTFNWTGSDDNTPAAGMSYSYKLDADPWSAWQLGLMTLNLSGLTDEDHTFSVRCRDTGNPALQCDLVPDTCDTCDFTVDTGCAFPPPNVINFQASDGDLTLSDREVELTWDALPGCVDTYEIERLEYDLATGAFWNPIQIVLHPVNTWTDPDARYCGWTNPIEYRVRAVNMSGTSPGWSNDTGYPITRKVNMAMWCVADDAGGTNPATPWTRAAADFTDNNIFWIQYGLEFISQNPGTFFWIPDNTYRHLTGAEGSAMHAAYNFPGVLDVYFVESSNGHYGRGYCMCYCPGFNHNLNNVYIVLCRDTRGTPPNENHIVLAHECGHGVARLWDLYLLDTNWNLILDDGTTCAADDTWCTVPPNIPWLFCDDNSAYPENPGAAGKTPKQLMWYSFVGAPISDYDITEPQWTWVEQWIHGYEGNYPYP